MSSHTSQLLWLGSHPLGTVPYTQGQCHI
jgi:hypothetical protein